MTTLKITADSVSALLEKIVKAFTFHHASFHIETRSIGDDVGFSVVFRTSAADAGKAVGKEGKTIKALKCLFTIMGQQSHTLINVMMDEPHDKDLAENVLGQIDSRWDVDEVKALLKEILDCVAEFPFAIAVEESQGMTTFIVVFDVPDKVPMEARAALNTVFGVIGKSHGKRCEVVCN